MHFDPALEAQIAFQRCHSQGELGDRWEDAQTWEETFSSSEGPDASDAYRHLVALGEEFPRASAYQEFLVYITWQQVTVQTLPYYFQQGARLCERFLSLPRSEMRAQTVDQVETLSQSFRAGLGQTTSHELADEYRMDTPKGGD